MTVIKLNNKFKDIKECFLCCEDVHEKEGEEVMIEAIDEKGKIFICKDCINRLCI
tara:strand:- start:67 stop:231 length:165 start_codon:yes stop_codon:yes gene_type:complete